MPMALVRVITDPRDHRAQLASLGEAPRDPQAAAERRDRTVADLRLTRERLEHALSGVTGFASLRNDQWSIVHVLGHLAGGSGGHFQPVYDIVLHGVTELQPFVTRDQRLQDATEVAFGELDGCIEFALRLTPQQLMLHASMDGRETSVIQFIECAAQHFRQHVDQIESLCPQPTVDQ